MAVNVETERKGPVGIAQWSDSAAAFADGSSSTVSRIEEERRELTKSGYEVFFGQITGIRGITTRVPRSLEDLNSEPKFKEVAFDGHDPRLGPHRGKWLFSAGSRWQVGIGDYKLDGKSDNRDYYKEYTDQQAVVVVHPEGRELERIIINIQMSQLKDPNAFFNTGIQGNMQVEEGIIIFARGHDHGWLQPEESRFAKMTELDLLRMVNSLAQIYKGTSK